jgi:adenine-specific DNA methylase
LIEVDLPIKRISAHARREKSIRHGHISTLHIWWARRPLAACRAVICAALWPDPADDRCPPAFRQVARERMLHWAREHLRLASPESAARMVATQKDPDRLADPLVLRRALLDFIADFANWDNSTVPAYLATSRALTQAAHESLGGVPGTRPLVVDPFAGGGSIPLEALRVGADAFASDLNPVAVLLNKVVLEYIPKYGQRLADEVRKWGGWIKREAEKELAEFYPKDPDGATPIAYLWARTIRCEGPGCGAEVPLIRSLWLAKKSTRSIALQLIPRPAAKRVDFRIIHKSRDGWVGQDDSTYKIQDPELDGTVKRGSATCPCCGYTTPVVRVREQLKIRTGGSNDARLMCVATLRVGEQGRFYHLPTRQDLVAVEAASAKLTQKEKIHAGAIRLVPDETICLNEIRRISVPIYGMTSWEHLFTRRQLLALTTIAGLIDKTGMDADPEFTVAVRTILGLAVNKQADLGCALTRWKQDAECPVNLFGRQAIGMVWDFAETVVISDSSGSWTSMFERTAYALESSLDSFMTTGQIFQCSATQHVLPSDSADALITDPPYYDAVPYAHLSDFFYVWLRRSLAKVHGDLFALSEVPKEDEIVVDRPHVLSKSKKDIAFYERELTKAFVEARRVLRPAGVGTVVFASKTTASWEAILKAVVDAGWIITGSWPIDTEMETRVSAQGQSRLASSVHLVCRPREDSHGSVRTDDIGAWRDVLAELPVRIHDWMPRLAEEGVVGADAIFACLGPALEVFSRYARVEKASGETVTLKEYLEQVWAAVAKEALSLVFAGADTASFEPDARLTAMWLWTLNAGSPSPPTPPPGGEGSEEDDEEPVAKGKLKGGFTLEYDAARKIAQGLGAHLEELPHLVEIKGDQARLLPVSERTKHLFGKDEAQTPTRRDGNRQPVQGDLFKKGEDEVGWGLTGAPKAGETALDRIHQGMILFAAGRGEALKRFLVEDGAGRDQRFWGLAQALSALYPAHTEEKRWVDGVLARKKSLGF